MKLRKNIIILMMIIGVLIGIYTFSIDVNAAAPKESGFTEEEWEILKLTNKERYNVGAKPLVGFPKFQLACDIRAVEIGEKYSHERPNGTECFTVLRDYKIYSSGYGENIYAGPSTPEYAVNGWMNSEGHRRNMLSSNFAYLGVGHDYSEINNWVQMFLYGDDSDFSNYTLVFPDSMTFKPGTTIENMGIYAKVNSSSFGTCYLPIIPEYCSGYDPNKGGTQTFIISVFGTVTAVDVKIDVPIPEKPYKIVNTVSGVHVYWNAVKDIKKYGVWRSETGVNGTYKWISNTTATNFTDTSVESGKTYYYKITAINTAQNTHYEKSEALGMRFVATPDITTRMNRSIGIDLGWNKIDGATGYAIYRRTYWGTDPWVRVATITNPNTLSWIDTSVKDNNGKTYRYTIRALTGPNRNYMSGCRSTGRTMVRMTTRTFCSVNKVTANSVKCHWMPTKHCDGYEVRFMVGSTVYKTYTVGNYQTGFKTFAGLKAGQTYKVQVRSYKKVNNVGVFYSAWSNEKYISL